MGRGRGRLGPRGQKRKCAPGAVRQAGGGSPRPQIVLRGAPRTSRAGFALADDSRAITLKSEVIGCLVDISPPRPLRTSSQWLFFRRLFEVPDPSYRPPPAARQSSRCSVQVQDQTKSYRDAPERGKNYDTTFFVLPGATTIQNSRGTPKQFTLPRSHRAAMVNATRMQTGRGFSPGRRLGLC